MQIIIRQSFHAPELCDLGESINLMPLYSYLKLRLGSPKRKTVILQLANRSIVRPEGVVEDVLVQLGSLIFPVDFEPNAESSSHFGMSFLVYGYGIN